MSEAGPERWGLMPSMEMVMAAGSGGRARCDHGVQLSKTNSCRGSHDDISICEGRLSNGTPRSAANALKRIMAPAEVVPARPSKRPFGGRCNHLQAATNILLTFAEHA